MGLNLTREDRNETKKRRFICWVGVDYVPSKNKELVWFSQDKNQQRNEEFFKRRHCSDEPFSAVISAVVVLVEQGSKHSVSLIPAEDFYVSTTHGSISEIPAAQNSSPLNVVFAAGPVPVSVSVECRARIFPSEQIQETSRLTSALFAANFTSIILAVGPFQRKTYVPVSNSMQSSSNRSS